MGAVCDGHAMIKIDPIHSLESGYPINRLFDRDSRERDPQAEVRWLGTGPELMGFGTKAKRPELQNLLLGRPNPGGTLLGFKFTEERPVVGWQAEISAPKSFSVLWAISSPMRQEQLERIHRNAVETTLMDMEKHALGKAGKEARGVFIAVSERTISEQGDPHLSSRFILLNLSANAERRLSPFGQSPLSTSAEHQQRTYGLAVVSGIDRTFGWAKLERSEGELQLSGVPKALVQEFSSGRPGPKFRGLDHWPATKAKDFPEQSELWQRRAAVHGWRTRDADQLIGRMNLRALGRAIGEGVGEAKRAILRATAPAQKSNTQSQSR